LHPKPRHSIASQVDHDCDLQDSFLQGRATESITAMIPA
jgi:hypothetical protein